MDARDDMIKREITGYTLSTSVILNPPRKVIYDPDTNDRHKLDSCRLLK